jgi:hypothetical protein
LILHLEVEAYCGLRSVFHRRGESAIPTPDRRDRGILQRISELSYEFMDYADDVAELAENYYRPLIENDNPP